MIGSIAYGETAYGAIQHDIPGGHGAIPIDFIAYGGAAYGTIQNGIPGGHCSITIDPEPLASPKVFFSGISTIKLVAGLLSNPTFKTPAEFSTALDFKLEGINLRKRDAKSSTEIEMQTSITPATLLGGKVGVTLNLTPDITETRIRDAISTIENTFSILKEITAQRPGSFLTDISINLDLIPLRKRFENTILIEGFLQKATAYGQTAYGSSGGGIKLKDKISLDLDINSIPTRKRFSNLVLLEGDLIGATAYGQTAYGSSGGGMIIEHQNKIRLELDSNIIPTRIRDVFAALDIAQSLLSVPTFRTPGHSGIEFSFDTFAKVQAKFSGQSNIQLIFESDNIPFGVELLMEFTGSLSSGDTIEVDGENLLITDSDTGENLRPQFDVSNWPDIGPNGAELRWIDEETGRTIELKIEKEDRTL